MIAACAQLDAKSITEADLVWPQVERFAERAADAGADLIVFPEATYPAYWLESKERYRQADIERSKQVLRRFGRLAAEHRVWLVVGFVEEAGEELFNSAAVFDRAGRLIGVARKNFLWDCDHKWFSPGGQLTVLATEFGRMGVLICADARVPEIPATLVSRGAQFIAEPTAWVNTAASGGERRNIQPEFLIEARAVEFAVPFLCASKSGKEGGVLEYVGRSRIVDAHGAVLASAGPDNDELVVAECTVPDCGRVRISSEAQARLLSSVSPYRAHTLPGPQIIRTRQPGSRIAASLAAEMVRIGRLDASDLESFAPARRHALEGAQVLLVQNAESLPIPTIRTRAAENRVFIVACHRRQLALVVDPNGDVIWGPGEPSDEVEIDPEEADRKQFTPTTDIWSQRRPESYGFAVEEDQ